MLRTCMRLSGYIAVLALPVLAFGPRTPGSQECETYRVTGYVRAQMSPRTYDGTSVWTREPVAAASWNVPIGAKVKVEGVGTFRVADRGGGLGPRHIDVLVDTVGEARALTSWRKVCVVVIQPKQVVA